jgi:protease I
MIKKYIIENSIFVVLVCFAFLNLFYSVDCFSQTNKIVLIIAHSNFRDEEFTIPKAIFEKNGYLVTVASSSLSESTGMLGLKVKPTILINKITVSKFDAVIFVGGTGSKEYFTNKRALKLAKDAFTQGKIIAAICLAPIILANAGLLTGKNATCNDSKYIQTKGAHYTNKLVEQDGNIITGIGPEASEEFAKTILKLLKTL